MSIAKTNNITSRRQSLFPCASDSNHGVRNLHPQAETSACLQAWNLGNRQDTGSFSESTTTFGAHTNVSSALSRPGDIPAVSSGPGTQVKKNAAILLSPRPYERHSGRFLVVPLLESKEPVRLPFEIWERIFELAMHDQISSDCYSTGSAGMVGWRLIRVCRNFKEVALPLIYSRIKLDSVRSLVRLYERIQEADQRWDSIRRIPYSAPGRWIQTLDIRRIFVGPAGSGLTLEAVYSLMPGYASRAHDVDSVLTKLFPLTPFLRELVLDPSLLKLSKRAWRALREVKALRVLRGIAWCRADEENGEEGLMGLLKHCPLVESLEVIGYSVEDEDLWVIPTTPFHSAHEYIAYPEGSLSSSKRLHLPNLHTLTILSTPTSLLLSSLLSIPLPSLTTLTLTPYNEIQTPQALSSPFVRTHGRNLKKLILNTPKQMGLWNQEFMPLEDVLNCCPNLRWLELEGPFSTPQQRPPPVRPDQGNPSHPLQLLTLPRPNRGFLLSTLEPLRAQGVLDNLKIVRMRDVRWLKMCSRAAGETGVQGEMRDWRRRLGRATLRGSGVVLVDESWSAE